MSHPTGPGHPGPDPGPITPTGPRVEPIDLTAWSLPVKPCCGEALAGEGCPCDDHTGHPIDIVLPGPWADLAPGGVR